jgi:hypothetical protein
MLTFGTLWDGEQNAGNEGLAIVRLLEDSDLLAEARTVEDMSVVSSEAIRAWWGLVMTYVPGFWSWKGSNSTVLTSMIAVMKDGCRFWDELESRLGTKGFLKREIAGFCQKMFGRRE